MELNSGDGLLVVDVQNDFLPGGALGVQRGDEVVPVLNRYMAAFRARGLPIFASRDWHPAKHCSFREQGGVWPVHCVVGTNGAEFHPDLHLAPSTIVISKATDPKKDAYSAFESTTLDEHLRKTGVRRLLIGGLDRLLRAEHGQGRDQARLCRLSPHGWDPGGEPEAGRWQKG